MDQNEVTSDMVRIVRQDDGGQGEVDGGARVRVR